MKSRTRSLATIGEKIAKKADILEKSISGLLADRNDLEDEINVLEVGFGWGRPLMELAWHFRDDNVTFHGINGERKPPVEKSEDLLEISRQCNIIPQSKETTLELPQVYFYDAGRLQFDDESMDLVYSVSTVRAIERKAEFLEEVCRVLKPGGIALLHMGRLGWNYPHGVVSDHKFLTTSSSQFVLKHDQELIPFEAYLKLFDVASFQLSFLNFDSCSIRLIKLKSIHLDLQLTFNQELTFELPEVRQAPWQGDRGGYLSVYDVSTTMYEQLFKKGFLSKNRLYPR